MLKGDTTKVRDRVKGWILAVVVVAACWVFGTPAAHAGILTDINKQRESLDLRQLDIGVDADALQIAERVAASDQTNASYFQDRAAALNQSCRCLVPTDRGSDYDGEDPSALYERSSGRRSAGFWTTKSGWSLERRVRFSPQLAALIYDPRARRISVVSRNSIDVIAVTADLIAKQATKALLVSPRAHDPGGKMPLIFHNSGPVPRMVAERRAGGRWLREARLMGSRAGSSRQGMFDGARDAVIPEDRRSFGHPLLAWGSRYRIRSPKWTLAFRTTRAPKGGRLHYARSARGYRKYFEAAIRSGHPFARRMLAQIAGYLRVGTHGGSDHFSGGGGSGIDMYRGHLTGSTGLRNHIIWHELGHVFDDSPSLSWYGRSEFTKQFKRSSHWKKCFFGQTVIGPGCTPGSEVFAEQFAFWATGDRNQRSGYDVPPLISRARMTKLIKKLWVPRPQDIQYGVDTSGR